MMISAGLFWASEGAVALGYPEPAKRGKYMKCVQSVVSICMRDNELMELVSGCGSVQEDRLLVVRLYWVLISA